MSSLSTEKRLLEKMLRRLDEEKKTQRKSLFPQLIVWLVVFVFTLSILQIESHFEIGLIFVILPSLLVGGFIGGFFMMEIGKSQFPIVKDHINRESIQSRLDNIADET